jgi:hypothetical protein
VPNTCYLRRGTSFKVSTREALDLHDRLPPGNYVIKEDPYGELYLDHIEAFEPVQRLYGNLTGQTQRILRTFKERDVSTGVLLAGEKGSGKTLLAKNVCIEAGKEGVPAIIINAPWNGDKFNSFVQQIDQPCIIIFDEFEKVYNKEDQKAILTLLDGVYPSKKLFILTCNNKWEVDVHMRNRPGRIYYMIDFNGLSDAFIEEYCNENLLNKDHIEKVCRVATAFDTFNFDMLKAMVEEMNRFNETPQEAINMLNTKPEFSNPNNYKIEVTLGGRKLKDDEYEENEVKVNPLFGCFRVCLHVYKPEDTKRDDPTYRNFMVYPRNLEKMDHRSGKFTFKVEDAVIVLTKVVNEKFSYLETF